MVAEFQKQVAEYLLKSPNKNTKKYYSDLKKTSLKDLDSYQHTNEDAVNRSLCLNRYNYDMEVLLEDNQGVVSKQVITNAKIQQRLLKCMENILQDDKVDYDEKMRIMTEQYEEIVRRSKTHAFRIRIPENYNVNMSDYNEYYQITEKKKIEYFKKSIDELTDNFIRSISISQKSIPTSSPIKGEPIVYAYTQEEKIEYEESEDEIIKENKPKQQQKSKPNIPSQIVQQPILVDKQPKEQKEVREPRPKRSPRQKRVQAQAQVQEDDPEMEDMERKRKFALEEIEAYRNTQTLTREQQAALHERQKEADRLHREIQRIKQEQHQFQYQKDESDSEDRFLQQKKTSQPGGPRARQRYSRKDNSQPGEQVPQTIQEQYQPQQGEQQIEKVQEQQQTQHNTNQLTNANLPGKQQVQDSKLAQIGMPTSYGQQQSIQLANPHENDIKKENIDQASKNSIIQQQNNNESIPTSLVTSQNTQSKAPTQHQSQQSSVSQPKPQQQISISQTKSESQHSTKKSDIEEIKANIVNSIQGSPGQGPSQAPRTGPAISQHEEEINKKLNEIQDNLKKAKLGIIDRLLEAECVYVVDIDDYKIGKFEKELGRPEIPHILESEDEKVVFLELY